MYKALKAVSHLFVRSCAATAVASLLFPALGHASPPQERPGFHPDRQQMLRKSGKEADVELVGKQRCRECETGYEFVLQVRRAGAESSKRITIKGAPAQIDDLWIVAGGKIAVVGQYQSSVDMVVLVDMGTGAVVDRWLCFEPTVSPDGRFIAFVKVYPLHFTEGVSAHYMLYATQLDAAANRPRGVEASDMRNVGRTIFPDQMANVPGDNTHVSPAGQHQLASAGFAWSAGSRYVTFADRADGVVSIVVVDLLDEAEPMIRTKALNPAQIVNPVGCRDYVDSGKISYAFTVARIEFVAGDAKTMRILFKFPVPECRGPGSLQVEM